MRIPTDSGANHSIVESHGGHLWAADNPPRGSFDHLPERNAMISVRPFLMIISLYLCVIYARPYCRSVFDATTASAFSMYESTSSGVRVVMRLSLPH